MGFRVKDPSGGWYDIPALRDVKFSPASLGKLRDHAEQEEARKLHGILGISKHTLDMAMDMSDADPTVMARIASLAGIPVVYSDHVERERVVMLEGRLVMHPFTASLIAEGHQQGLSTSALSVQLGAVVRYVAYKASREALAAEARMDHMVRLGAARDEGLHRLWFCPAGPVLRHNWTQPVGHVLTNTWLCSRCVDVRTGEELARAGVLHGRA